MKRKGFLSAVLGTGIAFLLSFCAVGCLVTGFGLPVTGLLRLLWLCAIFAALSALCCRFRLGGVVIIILAALAGVLLWRRCVAAEQIDSLLYNISIRYHRAYGIPVVGSGSAPVDFPLAAVGLMVALVSARAVCRRKSVIGVLLVLAVPVGTCVVVTDTVPDSWCIFGLMLGVGLLWLSDWTRQQDGSEGVRLLLYGAVPLAAALAVLFAAVPEKDYVNRAEEYQEQFALWAEKLAGTARDAAQEVAVTQGQTSRQVNLALTGPRSQWDNRVLQVRSPVTDTLYLREQDYGTYSGTGWIAARQRTDTFGAGGAAMGTLEIETFAVRAVRFVPYYPAEPVTLSGGSLENDGQTVYTYALAAGAPAQPSGLPDSQYSQLPTDTLRWALGLATQITASYGSAAEQAAAIGNYVRSSAVYDLDTPRMPDEEEDFARWFLNESDTGYCVHFATAATVLLRAAGIPARYVEGYMFTCRAGEETVVTGKSAHAWAEYYDGGVWHVLEATPADLSPETESTEASSAATEQSQPDGQTPLAQTLPRPEEPENGTAVPDRQPETGDSNLPDGLVWLLILPLGAAAVWAQSEVRIRRKDTLWNQGEPNSRALNRWVQVKQLARAAGMAIPEELEQLAQKAKFSQHTLGDGELARFDAFRRDAQDALGQTNWLRKLAVRLIAGVK